MIIYLINWLKLLFAIDFKYLYISTFLNSFNLTKPNETTITQTISNPATDDNHHQGKQWAGSLERFST